MKHDAAATKTQVLFEIRHLIVKVEIAHVPCQPLSVQTETFHWTD